jgi:membrane fusion protein (multidrug efflux system)
MKKIVQFLSIFVLGFISAVAVQETVGLTKLKNKILKSTEKLVGKKIRGIASAKNGDTEKIEDEKKVKKSDKKKKGTPVHTAVLGLRDIKKYFTTYGNLRPWKSVNLKPARDMTVRAVLVKVGDYVEVGETLVEFESELQNEKKKLAAIELKLKNAEFNLTKKLAMRNFISKNEMKQKQLSMNAQALRYKIEEIQSNKQFMKAPIMGIISSINLNPGDFINDTSKFTITIVDQEQFKVDLFLPPEISNALQGKAPVEIFRDRLDTKEKVKGKVISIAPTLDLKSGTVQTSLGISTPPKTWRSGMYVKVKIAVARLSGVLAIENSALVQEKNQMVAFKVVENSKKGSFVEKVIPLLGTSDGRYTEIKAGLEFFDKIVVKGQGTLKDQTLINVLK